MLRLTVPILFATILTLTMMLAASPLLAADYPVFIVTDPAEIQLVNLKPAHDYLTNQFSRRFDIFGAMRRTAAYRILRSWGVRKMPHRDTLELGLVVRTTHSSALEFVLVIRGDSLDSRLMRRRMVEKYNEHLGRHGVTPAPKEILIGGHSAKVLPMIDRTGEFVVVVSDGHLFLASTLPGQHEIIEQTAAAVASVTRAPAPSQVSLHYTGYLTEEERRRINAFMDLTYEGRVRDYRRGFEALYRRLGDFDPEELKTTNEKINELYLQLVDWSVDYEFYATPRGPVTKVEYRLQLPTPADALAMRDLFLERLVFYRDNAGSKGIGSFLESLALDVERNSVLLIAESDTEEGLYDFIAAYLAFLLSYSHADIYLFGE